MKSIKEEAEKELKIYREEQERNYQKELEKVINKILIIVQLKHKIATEGEGEAKNQDADVE